MEVVLHYEGALKTNSRYQVAIKHGIRQVFHRQLHSFCLAQKQGPYWPWVLTVPGLTELPLKGRAIQFPLNMKAGFVRVGQYECVPVITSAMNFTVDVTVHFHRREAPGAIVQGGDLDNRIKTLLDALRMPHSQEETCGQPPDDERRFYCLLEDDSLISSLTIQTHRLWQAPGEDGKQNDVRLALHVSIEEVD